MKKFFICALMVACLCAGSVFAVDSDLESFDVYSLSPLTSSALDYAVMPLSATSWDTADQNALYAIRNTLTSISSLNGGSILYNLIEIKDTISESYSDLLDALNPSGAVSSQSLYYLIRDIKTETDSIGNYFVGNGTFSSPSSISILGYLEYLPNLVYLQTIDQDTGYILEDMGSIISYLTNIQTNTGTTATWSRYLASTTTVGLWARDANGSPVKTKEISSNILGWVGQTYTSLMWDGVNPHTYERTLYSRIKQLQEVLASDDDLALAESQKQNREEIEDSFLSGSSGSTSLGASDFGDLSDVGGTVNDTLSLNGQASIGSFTSGLSDADSEGQNWFSSGTRDSLDSVSGSVSTFSLDDPYNMEGWEDNYSWVLGGE